MSPLRSLLLITAAAPLFPAFAQPQTPNQTAAESRREIEDSRREARENLERGRRGEIDPAEVRRARDPANRGASTVPPETIARWQAMKPQQLGTDPDFVRALQNEDPAALAHYEGIMMEIDGDLRADAASRRWLGGPVHIPGANSVEFAVPRERRQSPARRRPIDKDGGQEERGDDAPRRERNPIQEREALERDLQEARRDYDDAMRHRDDNPGNADLLRRAEQQAARVRLAEERYQAHLRDNAPGEARARQQMLESIDRRGTNPRQRERTELPRRNDPAERPQAPPLRDYDGRQGTNPDHRLQGTVDGRPGPVMPGRIDRQPPAERPQSPPLPDYQGRQGTNPDHRMNGTPEGGDGPVMPSRREAGPAPERPANPGLNEYQPRGD